MSYNKNENNNYSYEPETSYEQEINDENTYESENITPTATTETQPEPVQQIAPPKGNLAAGIVGAFLGSLIGCALWILIYRLGYIAGIAGFVIGVCALKGYEMLGKYLDIKGAIISVLLMVVMIFFANKLAWSWDAFDALKDYNWTFTEVFKNLDYIIDESGLTSTYYKDLIIGYILTALSSYKLVFNAFASTIKK